MNFINFFRRFSLVAFLLLACNQVFAVGAYPHTQVFTQTDGSKISVQLNGDEWFNWVSTSDGFRIMRNDEGVFEYVSTLKSGQIKPSGVKASDPGNRTAEELEYLNFVTPGPGVSSDVISRTRDLYTSPLLKSTNNLFPSNGQRKLLVILANFSNTQPTYTTQDFEEFMNMPNYNGTGSFRDYYLQNSGNQLDVTSVVTQWVTLPNSREYYGPQAKWGEFAYHAIQAASAAGVNFSQFDNTGNGVVESIAIIHHGPGQEVTGDENDIWSHAWSLSSAGYSIDQRTFNGVLVNSYTAQPETRNNAGVKNTIGVMCHEFGHSLGLPDYYDTKEGVVKYDGTGRWDIMASGNYNGSPSGALPAHHNAFSKIELGWINEEVISTPAQHTLSPVMVSKNVFRVNGPVNHEYFLLENRQKSGFDAALPGEGMLVYHVDADRITARRSSNNINTELHQGLYIKASGGNTNAASAPFPGIVGLENTLLTDYSTPAAVTWANEPFNRSITGIYRDEENVNFTFMAMQNGSPISFVASVLNHNQISLNWSPASEGYPVLLAFSLSNEFGEPVASQNYSAGDIIDGGGTVLYSDNVDFEFIHSLLEPSSNYYYKIWSDKGSEWSMSLSASGITEAVPVSEFPYHEGFEDGFLTWRQSIVAGDAFWSIAQKGNRNKPLKAFEGSNFAYFYSPTYDERVTRLISPVLNLDSQTFYTLDFRHTQHLWGDDQDRLRVLYKTTDSQEWHQLAFYEDNEVEWVHRRLLIPVSQPVQIAFEGYAAYGYGIGVDDVVVKAYTKCFNQVPAIVSYSAENISDSKKLVTWQVEEDMPVLVVMRQGRKVTELPCQGVNYSANAVFGNGHNLGNDSYVVYAGGGNQVEITGLDTTKKYYIAFFPYVDDFCFGLSAAPRNHQHQITFNVFDDSTPVVNATLEMDGDVYFSDADGQVIVSKLFNDDYIPYSLAAINYKNYWSRVSFDMDYSVNVQLKAFSPISVNNITHTKNGKEVSLTWNPVIHEDFDGYEPFSLTMPGWTTIDKDEVLTYRISNYSFPNDGEKMAFIVMDPYYEGLVNAGFNMQAYSGRQLLAAFSAINATNNNWLVSPAFTPTEGEYFSFVARSLSNTYGLESINVLVAVQDDEVEEFLLLSDGVLSVPLTWSAFNFALGDYAGQSIKVAIQHVSHDSHALFVDNVLVGMPQSVTALKSSTVTSDVERITSYQESRKIATYNSVSSSNLGAIGYSVFLNGQEIGSQIGFENNSFSAPVVGCDANIYRIETDYLLYNKIAYSDNYAPDLCSVVTFVVKDVNEQPLVGAEVDFYGVKITTDSNGNAVFNGVDFGISNYSVSLYGFEVFNGQIDVLNSSEFQIVLSVVLTNLPDDLNKNFTFHPNPVNAILYIDGDFSLPTKVVITDLSGRNVASYYYSNSVNIVANLSSLSSGIYIVEVIQSNNSVAREKIVVK